jgi:hypothetical protein
MLLCLQCFVLQASKSCKAFVLETADFFVTAMVYVGASLVFGALQLLRQLLALVRQDMNTVFCYDNILADACRTTVHEAGYLVTECMFAGLTYGHCCLPESAAFLLLCMPAVVLGGRVRKCLQGFGCDTKIFFSTSSGLSLALRCYSGN